MIRNLRDLAYETPQVAAASALWTKERQGRFGKVILMGPPCLAFEYLREAMRNRDIDTDPMALDQRMPPCEGQHYDAFVLFLAKCDPNALTLAHQRLTELRASMPNIPALALFEDADADGSGFAQIGFSTVVLGLPSVRFAIEVVSLALIARGLPAGQDSLASGAPKLALVTDIGATASSPSLPFTQREAELIAHLLRGIPNKLIAHELGISQSTVKAHMRNIIGKLKAKSRAHAICMLTKHAQFRQTA
jgi:DNA-binding NarL/FixJ family response regulator